MLVSAAQAQGQSQTPSTRHVREAVLNGEAQFVERLPATQSMRLVLVLPHRNQAELENLLKELYDPTARRIASSSRWKSSPPGLVPASRIMTP